MGSARLPGFDGSRLRAYRRERHWTILELAELTGLSRSSIQHWETGIASPDPRTAPKLAQVFGVRVQDLTTLADDDIGLTELRALAGKLASDIADSVGIDRTTWGEIERGFKKPLADAVDNVAALLEVDTDAVWAAWQRSQRRLRRRLLDDAE